MSFACQTMLEGQQARAGGRDMNFNFKRHKKPQVTRASTRETISAHAENIQSICLLSNDFVVLLLTTMILLKYNAQKPEAATFTIRGKWSKPPLQASVILQFHLRSRRGSIASFKDVLLLHVSRHLTDFNIFNSLPSKAQAFSKTLQNCKLSKTYCIV